MAKSLSADTAATLAPGVVKLLEAWRVAKRRVAEHTAQVAAARARLQTFPAEIVAAASNPSRLGELRLERAAVEQLVAEAPLISQGLAAQAEQRGLAWSTAWTEWKNQLAAEMLPDFAEGRRRLQEREAAARAAFEAKLREMPAA